MPSTSIAAFWGATALAGMLVAAQTPTNPPPGQPSTRIDQTPITVTGCLRPWDGSRVSAGPQPGRAADPAAPDVVLTTPRYLLVDVERGSSATAPPLTPSPAPAGAAPAHPHVSQFVLTPAPGLSLAAHVNHQVRVTGLVSSDSVPRPEDKGTPPPRAGEAPGAMTPPTTDMWGTMTATAVSMVSSTCPPAS